ncbi:MAG: hypothetical protein WC760_00020 [Bacteroidia bacterium]|jgi:hypothetical protein
MKPNDIIIIVLGLFSFASCCPEDKNKSYTVTRFKDTLSTGFIPTINGSCTFHTDSGKSMLFDEVTTKHEIREYEDCRNGECCHHVVNDEAKELCYISNNDEVRIRCRLCSEISTDQVYFEMTNFKTSSSSSPSFLYYVRDKDIKHILDSSLNSCVYEDTITLRNKLYTDIYRFFIHYSDSDMKYAEDVYYSNKEGVVGFKLNDKSIWTKD